MLVLHSAIFDKTYKSLLSIKTTPSFNMYHSELMRSTITKKERMKEKKAAVKYHDDDVVFNYVLLFIQAL